MDPMSYLNEMRCAFSNDTRSYQHFLDIMIDFKAGRISIARVVAKLRELFRGNESLFVGFNTFLPKEYQIVPLYEDENALSFVKKVSTVFRDDLTVFEAFLNILDMYSRGNKSIIEVYREVAVLFSGNHELLLEFRNFVPDTSVGSPISPTLNFIHAKKKRKIEHKSTKRGACVVGLGFFERVKATLCNSGVWEQLMKCVDLYTNEIVTRAELWELVGDLVGEYPELVKGLDEFLEHVDETKEMDDMCPGQSTDTDIVTCPSRSSDDSAEEIDLSKCELKTPSYRLLPNVSVDTGSVLNDQLKCVAPVNGREVQHGGRSCYENKLNECEDELFELDRLMHPIKETVKRAKKLLKKINRGDASGEKFVFCLDDYFTDQNLRCIKQVCSRRGPGMLDMLREKTEVALPVILKKLKMKKKESAQLRKGVAERMAGYHRKLLVHQKRCRKDSGEISGTGENESRSKINLGLI